MPQQFDFEDDDDFSDDEPSQDSAAIRQMRKQIKELSRLNKELSSENGTLKTQGRERTIAEVLQSKGVNPKVAKLIPSDIEATPDAVQGWVDDWADVFGIQVSPNATQEVAVVPEQQAAYARMQQVEDSGQSVVGSDALQQKLAAAGSRDELMSILRQSQGAGAA